MDWNVELLAGSRLLRFDLLQKILSWFLHSNVLVYEHTREPAFQLFLQYPPQKRWFFAISSFSSRNSGILRMLKKMKIRCGPINILDGGSDDVLIAKKKPRKRSKPILSWIIVYVRKALRYSSYIAYWTLFQPCCFICDSTSLIWRAEMAYEPSEAQRARACSQPRKGLSKESYWSDLISFQGKRWERRERERKDQDKKGILLGSRARLKKYPLSAMDDHQHLVIFFSF